uniref:Uncharacterized protein n=1 Tax=viral metagenome TaxID=1070528 RepID=A0A6C0JKJ3_9ZZZZ
MLERFDFVFSYWIFIWYIFYELKLTTFNPLIALLIGFIENISVLFLMFYYSNSRLNIFLFCFINFFIKVLPLWRLRYSEYNIKDFYALIFLFLIYILWLLVNKVDFKKIINTSYDNIKNNKPFAPFMYYMKSLGW